MLTEIYIEALLVDEDLAISGVGIVGCRGNYGWFGCVGVVYVGSILPTGAG
jgi:hypothetical protein